MLDWKTFTYSFVATEPVMEITGSFEKGLNLAPSDWGRWDDHNQLHGILNTYYPANNDSWWMAINGNYQSFTVRAKNYLPIADTLDNFMVVLCVTMDNGNSYLFRVFTDKGGYYTYNRAGIPLSKENASYSVDAEITYSSKYGYEYAAMSDQIFAKNWCDTLYMAMVITDANDADHCSGIITYSPIQYATNKLTNNKVDDIDPVCDWLVAYSQRAIIYLA